MEAEHLAFEWFSNRLREVPEIAIIGCKIAILGLRISNQMLLIQNPVPEFAMTGRKIAISGRELATKEICDLRRKFRDGLWSHQLTNNIPFDRFFRNFV